MAALEANGLFNNEELASFLRENNEGFFDNRVVKDFPQYSIHRGAKLLRSFKNFIPDQGVLRWVQDTASRFIQEDKIKGYLYLSVDPLDFLTLSENNASWSSCHSLDGDYRAGNLSYMVDQSTIIAYIADDTPEHLRCMPKDMEWHSKKWRMLVHLDEKGLVYYDKQYPFKHDTLLQETHRAILDLFFPKQLFSRPMACGFKQIKMPDGTTPILDTNYICCWGEIYSARSIINNKDYLGYTDLINSMTYTPVLSIADKFYSDLYWSNQEARRQGLGITIGAPVICPCCGKKFIQQKNSFLCDDCIAEYDADDDFYCRCSSCGHHLYDDDDYCEIDGELYCAECQKEIQNLEYGEDND